MAYRIECDRCGQTEAMKGSIEIPDRWLQFNTLWHGRGDSTSSQKPIEGGVFCPGCAKQLKEWRQPVPRCMPAGGM